MSETEPVYTAADSERLAGRLQKIVGDLLDERSILLKRVAELERDAKKLTTSELVPVLEENERFKQRIAELEAAQRPANPAGDDIAELVHRAQRSLDDPAASYEESIACATVAMAMMRLREYES